MRMVCLVLGPAPTHFTATAADCLSLCARMPRGTALAASPVVMESMGETLPGDGPLILVADADGEAGRDLAEFLARRGFRASHTPQGEDVLRLAHAGRLAIVIVDVTLADMSGHAVVSRLKVIDPRLPVLMTTGEFRPEFEVRARQIGILHYAQKPLDPERLEAIIAKAVGVARSA